MDIFVQILSSGLTLGAMYAISAVGLAIYYAVVQFMYQKENFETNIIIATLGLSILLENIVLKIWGPYPFTQPFAVPGGFHFSRVHIPYQNVVILGTSLVLMLIIAWLLNRTRMGRAIRATSQNREAAQLMGVNVGLIFAQVLAIAGVVAAVSGVMLSSLTTLSPTMGYDPMLKAFIICVIAGLGNVVGAFYAAFMLGLIEAAVQYFLGVRFSFPVLLLLVILALMWRPFGVFGNSKAARLCGGSPWANQSATSSSGPFSWPCSSSSP